MTTLARLVARARDSANQRLWETLATMVPVGKVAVLELLLECRMGCASPSLTGFARVR